MKLLFIASCLVASALAGVPLYQGAGYGQGAQYVGGKFGGAVGGAYGRPVVIAQPAAVKTLAQPVVVAQPVVQKRVVQPIVVAQQRPLLAANAGLGATAGVNAPLGNGVAAGGAGNGAGASADVDDLRASDEVWAQAARQGAANQWLAAQKDYGRDNGAQGSESRNNKAASQAASSSFGRRADAGDSGTQAARRAEEGAWSQAYGQNAAGFRTDAGNRAADQIHANGRNWREARAHHDDTDYAYDKEYELVDHEDGANEFEESSSSHAYDHARDEAASLDRDIHKNAAWASGADAQQASRKSAAHQAAQAAASAWDKFGRKSDSKASGSGRDKEWKQDIDTAQGSNRLWSDARKTASDIYQDLALADASYARNAKALAGKNAVQGGTVSATNKYGLAGANGYAGKYAAPGAAAAGLAKSNLEGDAAQAWDQAQKKGLRKTEGQATQDRTKTEYSKDQWLSDKVKGFDRNNAAAANDAGYSDWANQDQRAASKSDAAAAAKAQKWNKDQAAESFDEDLWKKAAEKERTSDRKADHKIKQKYQKNKARKGKNWERMNFDRDTRDDAFGYDTAASKDWSSANYDNAWKGANSANGRQAAADRSAAAARKEADSKWWNNADGFKKADKSSKSGSDEYTTGFNNRAWKKDQAQQRADAAAKEAQQQRLDSARAGLDLNSRRAAGGPNGAGFAGGNNGLGYFGGAAGAGFNGGAGANFGKIFGKGAGFGGYGYGGYPTGATAGLFKGGIVGGRTGDYARANAYPRYNNYAGQTVYPTYNAGAGYKNYNTLPAYGKY